MSDMSRGQVSALLPAVLVASGLSLAASGPALAVGSVVLPATGELPAVMQALPQGFAIPDRLAAYEREQAQETQVAMRFLDWLFGDEPVNRCGTTSGCRSGWDDSDCF
ncbi:hypothetical protein [Tabrizicola sp. YIM 78059]|uniref:hypothetical protein n=1 Tax=Tabrizicola sp. YIM 78059 TaxID=2529861 RepID=UPI0010AA050C|nr:hypothetical protein [Tabrizicola sp. YIM 78059]